MAVTADIQPGGPKAKRWVVTFALDADTTIDIKHGFNGIPDNVYLVPLNLQVYVGQVYRAAVTDTIITITKNAAVGSAGAAVELIAYIPKSSL